MPCSIVFSGLDSSVAGDVETAFAKAGYIVISNAKNHRMDPTVPLLIPEVNPDHLELVKKQKFIPTAHDKKGMIITNPNCSVIGLVMALKPLVDAFGVEAVQVVTMQAISGAGYPGVASLDIMDNVIPFIQGEEDKIETEPLKILGQLRGELIVPASMVISAQCNRVAVSDGHLACVSIKLRSKASAADVLHAWNTFTSVPQRLNLPMAPVKPLQYLDHQAHPQPKLHRHLDKGMSVAIGRLRECPLFDYKFAILSHNTVRGAAGAAILNAELLKKLELKNLGELC
jgi:aspartate-semialdehyde dehydrogenase